MRNASNGWGTRAEAGASPATRGDAELLAAVGRAGASLRAAVGLARGERRAYVANLPSGSRPQRSLVEQLERRGLLSVNVGVGAPELVGDSSGPPVFASAVPAPAARPSVSSVTPGDNASNVLRDAFVSANLSVPRGGIDPATLTSGTVRLYRSADGALVAASVNTSAGGDVLALSPSAPLDANTEYTFEVTAGLADVTGAAFEPSVTRFRTGSATGASDESLKFDKVLLDVPAARYTGVTKGPDGRLYAAVDTGEIYRFDVRPDGTLGAAQLFRSLVDAEGAPRLLTGIAFDPASTATDLALWATHSYYALDNGPDWTGKVTRLSGPDLATVQDYVVGLPRSTRDHVTNQLTFGPDGAVYFPQASNTAMGAPDYAWHYRPERFLSAAILRLDPGLVRDRLAAGKGPVDVKTEDGGTYDPFKSDSPVTIYATGVRNAYDLLWHSNGNLYAPANGSQRGGATPAGPGVPAIDFVDQVENDYLLRIDPGGYFGHPNPSRGQFSRNGGNPTAAGDPYEIPQYPVGTPTDVNYRLPAYDFGQHYSPNGVIEYRGGAFDGALRGKILVARFSGGDDVVVLTPGDDGGIVAVRSGIQGLRNFNDPLDLTEDPDTGFLYVAEFGGQRLTLVKPSVAGTPAGRRPAPDVAPLGPHGLIVAAGAPRALELRWTDTVGERGYEIERSDDGETGWAKVGETGANATAFTDGRLWRDTAYHYRVRAVNDAGGSKYSATTAGRTSAIVLPAGWSGEDVGAPGHAGGVTYAGGRFEILGAGAGIGGTSDAFFFGGVPVAGDVEIIARVAGLSTGQPAAAIGVMLRAGWDASAANAAMTLTGAGGAAFQTRDGAGAGTSHDEARGPGAAGSPYWVRLIRRADVVSGFTSADGSRWQMAASAYVALGEDVLAGLAVTSGNDAALVTAVIDNVSVGAAPPLVAPEAPADLIATAGGTRVVLNWTDNSLEESGFEVERRRMGGGGGAAWVRVGGVGFGTSTYIDQHLAAARKYEYRVRAVNAAGASAYSGGAVTKTGRSPVKGQAPFAGGTPVALPGVIEAELFDEGGKGRAWKDRTPDNDGGVFRDTGIDLAPTTDPDGGGYHVAAAARGEWLEYTVAVPVSGTYAVELRAAAPHGYGGSARLEFGGPRNAAAISIPASGGWDVWHTAAATVNLRAGVQVMRLAFDAAVHRGGEVANVNWIRVSGPTAVDPTVAAVRPRRARLDPAPATQRRIADELFNTTVAIVP